MNNRKINVCIFGLGRIGLPIALVCADNGYVVTGIDTNKKLITTLLEKKIPFNENGLKDLLLKHIGGNFLPKNQDGMVSSNINESDYIIISVGTGFVKYPEKPSLHVLYSIIGQLVTSNIKNKTIILRVTLPIGTTDMVKSFIERRTGLKESKDFFLAFVPERLMEGNAISEEQSLPKIIGTYSDDGFQSVCSFFRKIGGDIIRVSNPKTAEFVKLVDNSWRSTCFAFANDLAVLSEEENIDVIEAITSANIGYDRNMIPRPGPVSGYCLGKDPYILEIGFENIANKRKFHSLWYYGCRGNEWVINNVIEKVIGRKVLILGASFKSGVDDFRFSHGISIIKKLLEDGKEVYLYDPYYGKSSYTCIDDNRVNIVSDPKKYFDTVDTIIMTVKHSEFRDLEIPSNVNFIDMWKGYWGEITH